MCLLLYIVQEKYGDQDDDSESSPSEIEDDTACVRLQYDY